VERRRHPSCEDARQPLCRTAARTVARSIPYPPGRSGHNLALAAAQIPSGYELREAAETFDAIADWSISFCYPADDPSQAEPLPELGEAVAWLQRLDTFRVAVAAAVAAPPV
jgi:hypothetical protein